MALKTALIALLLFGAVSAKTWQVSILDLGTSKTPFMVKVFFSDEYDFNKKINDRAYNTLYGTYQQMHDGSAGYITLNSRVSHSQLACALSHEICHAKQDRENRDFDEKECYKRC